MWRLCRTLSACCLALLILTPALASGAIFTDLPPTHPNYDAVSTLAASGSICGYEDGTFRPTEPLTRAQFSKMMVILLGIPVSGHDTPPFSDVEHSSDSLYPDNYIGAAAREGIVRGLTKTSFGPNEALTHAQCLTMLVRAADLLHPGSLAQPDRAWRGRFEDVDPTHRDNIRRAEYSDLLSDVDLPDFDLLKATTRAEAAQMLANLVKHFGPMDVRDFGAQGDGSTDDRAAIDTAIKAAISQNRPLYFPAGRYKVEFTPTNYCFNYSNSALSIVGAGEENTVIDVYPKDIDGTNWLTTWTQLKYAVFLNWSANGALTLQDIAFAGPTSYTTAYPNQQANTYLVFSQASSSAASNSVTLDHVKATEGKFYCGIVSTGGHGSVILRGSTITAWNTVVLNYESTGTVMDRATIIEDSIISSGMPSSLTSDGQNHGIIVYNHPHVALRISRSTLWGNPRGAAKQYGESSAVAHKVPLYSILEDVKFLGNSDYTFITPGAPVTTYITNCTFDMGRIGVRNDTVISGSTFTGDGRTSATTYKNLQWSSITLKIDNSSFVRSQSEALDPTIGTIEVTNTQFDPTATTTTTAPPTLQPQVTNTTLAAATTTLGPTTTTTVSAPPSEDPAQLSIESPTDGSLVQGSVKVRTAVASAVAVGKVQLYVDDRLVATDYREPYAFTWSTKSVSPGSSHMLTGKAYGSSDEQLDTSAVAVKVANSASSKSVVAAANMPMDVFPDLTLSSPYCEAVLALAEAGVVSGFDDGNFGADKPVTRAQVAKMIAGTLGIADGESTWTPFLDLDPVDANLYKTTYGLPDGEIDLTLRRSTFTLPQVQAVPT